jgi:hypothetical protein
MNKIRFEFKLEKNRVYYFLKTKKVVKYNLK